MQINSNWERRVSLDSPEIVTKEYNLLHSASKDSYDRERTIYGYDGFLAKPQLLGRQDHIGQLLIQRVLCLEPLCSNAIARTLGMFHSIPTSLFIEVSQIPKCFGSYAAYYEYNTLRIESHGKSVPLVDRARTWVKEFNGLSVGSNGNQVVIHGDLCVSNVMQCKDGARFIDFECTHVGPREFDFGIFFSHHFQVTSKEILEALELYRESSGFSGELRLLPWLWFDGIRRYRYHLSAGSVFARHYAKLLRALSETEEAFGISVPASSDVIEHLLRQFREEEYAI